MLVRFTVATTAGSGMFEAGKVYDLPLTSAKRWIRRGVAEEVPAEVRPRARPQQGMRKTTRPKVNA